MKKRLASADLYIQNFSSRLNRPVIFWICAIIYRISLDMLYLLGFRIPLNPNTAKYAISLLIYLALFYLIPKKEMDFASFLLNLQFAITVSPMLSYYALTDQSMAYILMVAACILLQIFILRRKTETIVKSVYIERIQPYTSGVEVL